MTLQPFEYQRRTNIEEHNQMVEKINEIVDTINNNGLATDLPERVSELEQNAVTQDNRLTSETTARENMDTQLGRRIDTAFSNIIAFDGRITANETEIAGLKTGVDRLNTEMGGLSTEIGNIETEFNRYASKIRAVNDLHFTYNGGLTSANIDFTVEVECPESADPTAYRVCILEDPVGLLGKDVTKSITDFQIVSMATTEGNIRTFKGRIVYDPSKLPEAYDTTFANPTAIAVPSGLFSQDCWPNMTRMLNTESGGFTPWVEVITSKGSMTEDVISGIKDGDEVVISVPIPVSYMGSTVPSYTEIGTGVYHVYYDQGVTLPSTQVLTKCYGKIYSMTSGQFNIVGGSTHIMNQSSVKITVNETEISIPLREINEIEIRYLALSNGSIRVGYRRSFYLYSEGLSNVIGELMDSGEVSSSLMANPTTSDPLYIFHMS